MGSFTALLGAARPFQIVFMRTQVLGRRQILVWMKGAGGPEADLTEND